MSKVERERLQAELRALDGTRLRPTGAVQTFEERQRTMAVLP